MDICRVFLFFMLTSVSTSTWVGASDTFSSVAELERLSMKEKELGQQLTFYLDSLKTQIDVIQKYISFFLLYKRKDLNFKFSLSTGI